MENEYAIALDKLKQKRKVELEGYNSNNLSIEDGVLWFKGYNSPDMHMLQLDLNEILNQKVFRAEYFAYKDVYARDENEAKEFLNRLNAPKATQIKVYPTELKETSF